MNITDPEIEKYLFSLCPEEPGYVTAMEAEARKREFPIIDRLVGRLFFLIARLKDPSLVVELGSGFGYSAYWFARGMKGGKVVLTDWDPKNLERARAMLEMAELKERAEFVAGDALESARAYREIDILFIDMDKWSYLPAFKELEPNLAPGALVIADNTLWYGRVLSPDDEDSRAIVEFNDYMFSHPGFDCSLVPLRDGVLIGLKKG